MVTIMKKILLICLLFIVLFVLSCGKAGSYADDAYKAVKSHIDDIKPKPKGHGFHKCRRCNGEGVFYNGEDCPNCVGGYVYE